MSGVDDGGQEDASAYMEGALSSSAGQGSEGKLFIGGISWETVEPTLYQYFSQYGPLSDCILMTNKWNGTPRGFAFVTYHDPSVIPRVLMDEHRLDGRLVEVKRAVPREGGKEKPSNASVLDRRKIFVGGIASLVTDEEFRGYFEQFGTVIDSVVMMDRDTNRTRGFGFVTYAMAESVAEVLRRTHALRDKVVEIKPAEPKWASSPTQQPQPQQSHGPQQAQYAQQAFFPPPVVFQGPGHHVPMQFNEQQQQFFDGQGGGAEHTLSVPGAGYADFGPGGGRGGAPFGAPPESAHQHYYPEGGDGGGHPSERGSPRAGRMPARSPKGNWGGNPGAQGMQWGAGQWGNQAGYPGPPVGMMSQGAAGGGMGGAAYGHHHQQQRQDARGARDDPPHGPAPPHPPQYPGDQHYPYGPGGPGPQHQLPPGHEHPQGETQRHLQPRQQQQQFGHPTPTHMLHPHFQQQLALQQQQLLLARFPPHQISGPVSATDPRIQGPPLPGAFLSHLQAPPPPPAATPVLLPAPAAGLLRLRRGGDPAVQPAPAAPIPAPAAPIPAPAAPIPAAAVASSRP